MSTALRIGSLQLASPVVLAPMAGVTTASFRRLCRRQGAGLYVSEMLQAGTLMQANPRTVAMAAFAADEQVRSVQLAATDPQVIAAAVGHLVGPAGAQHIDLNAGCPVPKVTRKGGGAALAGQPDRFRTVVRAAVQAAGQVPVTVKLRIGLDDGRRTFLTAGRIAEEEGAAAVALHARTAAQLYSGPADWSAIRLLKEVVRTIPVLGNGDIWQADDAVAMMAATGCDGVVIGRGCLGRPWLFSDLARVFRGQAPDDAPCFGEVRAVMAEHLEMLCAEKGELAGLRSFRKHVGWYCTGYPVGADALDAAVRSTSPGALCGVMAALDAALRPDPAALAGPRGTVRGPQEVALPEGLRQESLGFGASVR